MAKTVENVIKVLLVDSLVLLFSIAFITINQRLGIICIVLERLNRKVETCWSEGTRAPQGTEEGNMFTDKSLLRMFTDKSDKIFFRFVTILCFPLEGRKRFFFF